MQRPAAGEGAGLGAEPGQFSRGLRGGLDPQVSHLLPQSTWGGGGEESGFTRVAEGLWGCTVVTELQRPPGVYPAASRTSPPVPPADTRRLTEFFLPQTCCELFSVIQLPEPRRQEEALTHS